MVIGASRESAQDSSSVVRQVEALAIELGRIPSPAEVHKMLWAAGLSADAWLHSDGAGTVADSSGGRSREVARTPRSIGAAGEQAPDPDPPATAPKTPAEPAPASADWWDALIDIGTDGPPAIEARAEGLVADTVADLVADWERAGHRLEEATVVQLTGRRGLDAAQRTDVLAGLAELGIVPLRAGHAPAHALVDLDDTAGMSADGVRAYLGAVARYRLLRAEEEVVLGRLVERGIRAEEEISQRIPDLDRQTLRQLELEVRRGHEAREEFVSANLRLVVAQAKRHLHREEGLEFLDLIQFGNLGLIRAVEKYDPELGYKFSTYATWWIRQSIERGIADTARLVRVPVHAVESLNRVRAVTRRLRNGGHEPTAKDVALLADLSETQVHFLWSLDRPMVRLDAPVAESDSRLGDVMGLRAAGRSPVAEAILEETLQEVEQLIDRNFEVDWRAAEILRMRFGIGLDEPMTLDAVGREFKVTRERIRQIEKKSLEALRSKTTPEEIRELLRGLAS